MDTPKTDLPPETAEDSPTGEGLGATSCSKPIYPSAPDGKWHLAVRSPDAYGFDVAFDTEADFLEAIDAIQRCALEPEGLAANIQFTTEAFASNGKDDAHE